MDTTAKGNKLEDAFYDYLADQRDRGELVYGTHPAQNCKLYKKKKYWCKFREAEVQFDVVLEIFRTGSDTPYMYVFFECKNYGGSVSDDEVRAFSDKIAHIFPHSSKGVMVVASRLQSGADKVARNYGMGIVKFDYHGFEVVAERTGSFLEYGFIRSQIYRGDKLTKSLKFSAFHDGKYFSTIGEMLADLDADAPDRNRPSGETKGTKIPYLSLEEIRGVAAQLLESTNYTIGTVDLAEICRALGIGLQFSDRQVVNGDGIAILGSANFQRKTITINSHALETRERFTIAHEIGHFVLNHERYLRSDTIVQQDLYVTREKAGAPNFDRLEYQANAFASELILPDTVFKFQLIQFRRDLNMKDRGHGYIYVDDQPDNFSAYYELLARLSTYFQVSKEAIEHRLKKLDLLNDQRRKFEDSLLGKSVNKLTAPYKQWS